MNHKTLLSLVILLNLLRCSSVSLQNNYEADNLLQYELIGNVKFVESKTYFPNEELKDVSIDNIDLEKDFRYSGGNHYFFDSTGFLKEHKFFQPQYLSWHAVYDHQNIMQDIKYYDVEGEVRQYLEVSRDQDGNIIEQGWINKDGKEIRKRTLKYNELHQKIEESGKPGSRNPTFKYKYDRKGREKERATYFKDELSSRRINSYYKDGFPSEVIAYKADGTVIWKETYTYDGKTPTERTIDNPGNGSKTFLEYNENGIPLTKKTWKTVDGEEVIEVLENKFKFDERGNWTLCLRYIDGKFENAFTRTLEYW